MNRPIGQGHRARARGVFRTSRPFVLSLIPEHHLYKSPNHHLNFLTCVKTRQRPICDVEIGATSVTVCHLGNLAYWLDRPLQWDPAKREIIGDEQASRMLDIPRRDPWRLEA